MRPIIKKLVSQVVQSLVNLNCGIAITLVTGSILGSCPLRAGDGEKLDVNDVSFLWPVAKEQGDVDALISLDEKTVDAELMPEEVFKNLIDLAKTVDAGTLKISFPGDSSTDRHAWKVVGIRVNPSAFGSNPSVLAKTGEAPGIRLIVQPVKSINGKLNHDFAVHVVYNFLANSKMPFEPDREAFLAAIHDLQKIKAELKVAGIETTGKPLNVHPGFLDPGAKLTDKLRAFVRTHLSRSRLQVISFMGVPSEFEPWIFFRVNVAPDNTLVSGKINGHFGSTTPMSQMINFRGDTTKVFPVPAKDATAAADGFGLSTAPLFESGTDLNAAVFAGVTTAPLSQWMNKDIPDLIANPALFHTGNADCASCHSETTRRFIVPGLNSPSKFAFKLPTGVSGVDIAVLPKDDDWNVRAFGWGFNFSNNPGFHPTISQRAANEAAESTDLINRKYLGFQ